MTHLHTTLLLIASFLAVFVQASFDGTRPLLGVQLDFLTPLIVCAALGANLTAVTLLAVCGGLCFDSLSANPLGASILPLFLPGFVIYTQRALILREQRFAQSVLAAGACAAFVVLSLVLLMTLGRAPVLGWNAVWYVLVPAAGGALLGPLYVMVFEWLDHALFHPPSKSAGYNPDRQIKRDRHLS